MAYAVIISRGIKSLPMLKCLSERCVCAPQSLSAGTFTSPRLSVSMRYSDILGIRRCRSKEERCRCRHDRAAIRLKQFLVLHYNQRGGHTNGDDQHHENGGGTKS